MLLIFSSNSGSSSQLGSDEDDKKFSTVVNTVVTQGDMPRFSGLIFLVVVVSTCRCSNLLYEVLEIGWTLRLSMHTFNTGVVLFHPDM